MTPTPTPLPPDSAADVPDARSADRDSNPFAPPPELPADSLDVLADWAADAEILSTLGRGVRFRDLFRDSISFFFRRFWFFALVGVAVFAASAAFWFAYKVVLPPFAERFFPNVPRAFWVWLPRLAALPLATAASRRAFLLAARSKRWSVLSFDGSPKTRLLDANLIGCAVVWFALLVVWGAALEVSIVRCVGATSGSARVFGSFAATLFFSFAPIAVVVKSAFYPFVLVENRVGVRRAFALSRRICGWKFFLFATVVCVSALPLALFAYFLLEGALGFRDVGSGALAFAFAALETSFFVAWLVVGPICSLAATGRRPYWRAEPTDVPAVLPESPESSADPASRS